MKSKITFLIIFGILIIFGLAFFLNKKPLNQNKTYLASLSKNEEILRLEDKQEEEKQPEKESQPDNNQSQSQASQQNIKSNIETGIKDPQGQLVHHLFNITNIPGPKCVTFSSDGKEIWVTSLLNQVRGIVVFNPSTGEKIKDINLENGGGVEIIFSKDGKKAYVSQMETAKVFEIDADKKEILRFFDTKSAWTKMLAFSSDQSLLYASNWSGDNVSEIDLATGKTLRLIPTVDTPRGIYLTKNDNTLYVAGFGNGEIEKIDLETKKGKIIFQSKGAMRHIAVDEEKGVLYFSDMGKNTIWKVSLKDDTVTKFADTDFNPNTIVLSPDKKILYVSCRGKNYSADNYYVPGPDWGSVLLFDTETGKILDAIIGGNQPTGMDISPDGKLLIFSDFLDAKLEVFEIPSYEVLKNGNGGRSKIYKSELLK
jgi:DNA-binding beta-propeller fold protein YncE